MKRHFLAGPCLGLAVVLGLVLVGCSDESPTDGPEAKGPILIEPNLAVGKVRAGMHVEEVIAQLGQPQRRTANALEYTRLGFAVMPGQDGVVQVVMCGDVIGLSGPLVKAFTGRTKEGIGLNSKREEIVKSYGEPSSSEKLPGGTESLKYNQLGITFTLEAGKVYHMIVRLPGSQAPDRSVSLEPPPLSTPK